MAIFKEVFEKFIDENNLKCLCLSHNKNDKLETLLMRFLQGAGTESRGGIPQVRNKYVRPLLDIERTESHLLKIRPPNFYDFRSQHQKVFCNHSQSVLAHLILC